MSKLTEDELAMLTEEERAGFLDDDDEGDDDGAGEGEGEGATPAVKQADKDDDGAGDDAGAGDDTAKGDEVEVEITPPPKPLFKADLPADLESKRTDIDTREDSLVDQFDNGDITFAEYNKQVRALNQERGTLDRQELKAELSREATENQTQQGWANAEQQFFANHPELKNMGNAQLAALDHLVRSETAVVMEKGGAIGIAELERAYSKYKQEFGIQDTVAAKEKPRKSNMVPPTLGKVPASAATDTDDGKFAHLDRLADSDPLAYETAVAKMSAAQRDEYMRAG